VAQAQEGIMLQRIDLRSGLGTLREVLPRAAVNIGGATATVGPLIEDVRSRGAAAVLDAAERFDGVRPAALRVPKAVIEAALAEVSAAVRAALTESIARARVGHTAQLPTPTVTQIAPGGTVTQRW
jgi:histidinol dehydrogenase